MSAEKSRELAEIQKNSGESDPSRRLAAVITGALLTMDIDNPRGIMGISQKCGWGKKRLGRMIKRLHYRNIPPADEELIKIAAVLHLNQEWPPLNFMKMYPSRGCTR